MATYAEIRSEFYDLSGTASQAVRTSALSGIGAIWIVSQAHLDTTSTPSAVLHRFELAALWFIIALVCDLLHYFVTSAAYWLWMKQLDKKYKGNRAGRDSADPDFPTYIRITPWIFYAAKGAAILYASYVFCRALYMLFST